MSQGGKGGGTGGNVYDQSATALGGAGNAYTTAGNMFASPGLTGPASTVADPAKISSGIAGYMNPYTNDVIDRSIMNVDRLTGLQQDQNAAGAVKSGAFGGARHGLVEATTNSEAQRNIGDLSANLLNTGWDTAARLSGQDIANKTNTGMFNAGQKQNWGLAQSADEIARGQGLLGAGAAGQGLGSMLFGMGNDITNQQMGAGSLQQQLIQQIFGQGQGQYGQAMGRPENLLNMQLQALGMNPMTNATTTTGQYNPGLFDYLSLAGQSAGNWMGMKAAG